MKIRIDTSWNCSYYPILFMSEEVLLTVQKKLNDQSIFPRRYFYPSLNTLSYVPQQSCEFSEQTSEHVLCLPLFYELSVQDQQSIVKVINDHG